MPQVKRVVRLIGLRTWSVQHRDLRHQWHCSRGGLLDGAEALPQARSLRHAHRTTWPHTAEHCVTLPGTSGTTPSDSSSPLLLSISTNLFFFSIPLYMKNHNNLSIILPLNCYTRALSHPVPHRMSCGEIGFWSHSRSAHTHCTNFQMSRRFALTGTNWFVESGSPH